MSQSLTALYLQNPELANALRKREAGQAMMQQGMDSSPVQHWSQGVSRLAQALIGGYEANKADREFKEYGEKSDAELKAFSERARGGGMGAALMQAPDQPPAAPAMPAASAPRMPPMGSSELMGMVAPVAQRYGVPLSLAMALVQQESGGNPGAVGDGGQSVGLGQIQARTATNPGYGVAPMDPAQRTNPEANLDFAMRYLVGKGRHMGATDLNDPSHQDIALRAYNGGGDPNYVQNVRGRMGSDAMPVAGPGAGQGAPQGQPSPMVGSRDLAEAQRLAALAQEASTSRNPNIRAQAPMLMQQAQMAQQAALQRQPQETEAHRLALQAGLQPGTPQYQEMMLAVLRGKAAGQTTNITMPPQTQTGPIPPGFQLRSVDGVLRMEPILGGPADTKATGEKKKEESRDAATARSGNIVVEDIKRIGTLLDTSLLPATGIGATTLSAIPGTASHDVAKLLDGIKGNIAFDKLSQMRESSPTGGALGAVSDREMGLLQSVYGSLEQSQSTQQFKENLARLKTIYLDIVHGSGKWKEAKSGEITFTSNSQPGAQGNRPPLDSFRR